MESNDERIWPVLNSIIACDSFEHVSQHILKPLTELLAAESAVYIEITRKEDENLAVRRCFSYGEINTIIDQYVNDFYYEDPLIFPATKIAYGCSLNEIKKVQLREEGQLQKLDKRTRYYKQFIEANHLEDVLGSIFPIGTNNDRFVCIGVHKFKQQSIIGPSSSFRHEDYFALEKLIRPLGTTLNNIFYKNVGNELKTLVSLLDSGYKNMHYIFFDAQMIPRKTSTGITRDYYSLIMDRASIQNLKLHAENMQRSLSQTGSYPIGESLSLAGLGQVKLLLSQATDGEISHLLIWEQALSEPINHHAPPPNDMAELTDREKQVIQQLAMGKSNKLIAYELHISIRTVENHLRSIYEKLGVHTRGQLIHAVSSRLTGSGLRIS